jgi:hypothetical protein
MTLKMLFRFHERLTISRLFQIARVSHSKDDTKILESTVLNPIGESLRRISHGGHFIVYSDTNDSLGLTFNLNVSFALTNTCKTLCIAVILHLVSLYFQENVSEQSLVCSIACQILFCW